MADNHDATHVSKKTDFWTTEQYSQKVAPFVAQLTTRVVEMLNPKSDDTILDIGCGDGKLTDALSARCRSITGVDASTNMINSMLAAYPHIPAFVLNCSDDLLPAVQANSPFPPGSTSVSHPTTTPEALHSEQYTAIFSNAALHWILAPPAARRPFFQACHALLKPGGRLVAEAGTAGNVAEVHGAIVHELVYGQGISLDKVRAQDPWWFGSLQEYRSLVEAAGLEWVRGEVELRPTRLTEGPEGGVKGWFRLFASPFAALLPGGADGMAWDQAVERAAQCVEYVGRRADGGIEVNYIRVRFEAKKPT